MKAIKQAQTRDILDSYHKEEISYSRMNEMFNELADKFAISFYNWIEMEETQELIIDLQMMGELPKEPTTQQLLEIYKKENL